MNPRHVVIFRGPAPKINALNITFDRDVPTPVDLQQYEKLNLAVFDDYREGVPCKEGRPILIKLMHYPRMVMWSKQFVEIVRVRYPTCPIVIHGIQPGFEVLFEDIENCQVLFNPNHAELKSIQPYREFDLTYGDQARMGRRPLTLVAAPYGAQTAIAFNIIYGFRGWQEEIPPVYPPIEMPAQGDYVLLVEYGPNRERSWDGLREAMKARLDKDGIAYKSIKVSTSESFRQDWELVKGAYYCIFCGESDLVYAAALQGKRGVFASREDQKGWPLRAQLKGSWFPENGLIPIEDGTPPTTWADRIVRKVKKLAPGAVPVADEPPGEGTLLLKPSTGEMHAQSNVLG